MIDSIFVRNSIHRDILTTPDYTPDNAIVMRSHNNTNGTELSANDSIIPTEYQQDYVDALIAEGIDPTVRVSALGHYATIGMYCLGR